MAKNMPPTGDLNIAAIPAPAPHAINTITASLSSLNKRAMLLPIAPPANAIGPSAPAEPPAPRVSAVMIIE